MICEECNQTGDVMWIVENEIICPNCFDSPISPSPDMINKKHYIKDVSDRDKGIYRGKQYDIENLIFILEEQK